MSNSKAPIRLYSSSFAFVAEIDDYEQSYFTRSLTGYGEFQITLNYNSPYASLFRKDSFVLFGTDRRRVGVIEDIERQIGSGGKGSQKVIVSGYQAKAILSRRIVIPASGQDYYAASAVQETVMKNLVLDHIGSSAITARKVSFLTVLPTSSRGDVFELKVFNSLLSDCVKSAAESSSPYIGTEIYIDSDGEGLTFDVIVGKDRRNTQSVNRRICFSSEFDTVKSGSLIEQNSGYRNVIYVGGQGDGNAKTIIKVTDPIEETGVARREKYFDASSLQTVAQLTNAGESELNALKQAVLAIDVDVLVKSQYVYGVDYDLGDLVNIKEYGELFEAQITEVTESWGHGTYDIVVGFGKSAPTIASSMSSIFSNADQTNTNKSALNWKDKSVTYDWATNVTMTQTFDEILADVIRFSGSPGGNRTLILQTPEATSEVGAKTYRLVVTPQVGSGSAATLTIKTNAVGTGTVVVPLIAAADTLNNPISFDVTVDSAGNVRGSFFEVFATNSLGRYSLASTGTAICEKYVSAAHAITTASGSSFVSSAGFVLGNWPMTFFDTPSCALDVTVALSNATWIMRHFSASTTSAGQALLGSTASRASTTTGVTIIARGRWI